MVPAGRPGEATDTRMSTLVNTCEHMCNTHGQNCSEVTSNQKFAQIILVSETTEGVDCHKNESHTETYSKAAHEGSSGNVSRLLPQHSPDPCLTRGNTTGAGVRLWAPVPTVPPDGGKGKAIHSGTQTHQACPPPPYRSEPVASEPHCSPPCCGRGLGGRAVRRPVGTRDGAHLCLASSPCL